MKVAAIQFQPVFGNKAANLKKMAALGKTAAEAGAKLIVFPELATSGYSFMSEEEARPFADIADIDDNPASSFSPMVSLAGKYGVAVVWGFIEMDSGTGKIYNSQAFVEERKKEDGTRDSWYFETYRKINPWGNDYLWSARGTKNPPVVDSTVLDKRVGLLICRDIRDKKNDEWNNFYSRGDADIVAFSTNWGDGGFPATTWMDFSEEHGMTLVVANRYGQETCNNFGEGGSCVIEPTGKVHCQGLIWNEDCIIIADI